MYFLKYYPKIHGFIVFPITNTKVMVAYDTLRHKSVSMFHMFSVTSLVGSTSHVLSLSYD